MTETKIDRTTTLDIDEPLYRLECACHNLMSVQEAMEAGNYPTAYYAESVLASYLMIADICDEMKALVAVNDKEAVDHE